MMLPALDCGECVLQEDFPQLEPVEVNKLQVKFLKSVAPYCRFICIHPHMEKVQ